MLGVLPNAFKLPVNGCWKSSVNSISNKWTLWEGAIDVQQEGLYVDRAFGGDCHYRPAIGDTDAGSAASEGTGKGTSLQVQS
jgi:hypothetical protein